MLTISDTFTDLSGTPIPNISVWITPDNGFLQFIGGNWEDVSREPKTSITDGAGLWQIDVPWPSVCSPTPLFWTLRDPQGLYFHGAVPEGIATATLRSLRSTYGWTETS